jgi:mRNA-degrading endonuclease YafQ of YafQ-DinJ toxin-antitoxin module
MLDYTFTRQFKKDIELLEKRHKDMDKIDEIIALFFTAPEPILTCSEKTAPSDGPPGLKTIWKGLQKFYTLLDYRELFDFVGQV